MKAVYTKEINGTQKVGALEIGTSLGVNLTRKINVFWGVNLGVAVMSRFQYTQKTSGQLFKKDADGNQSWIPFSEKHTAPSEGNYSGTDIIKINAMYGLRYELYDHLHITLVYVNDIWGINFSEENLARSYKYRTLLLGIEVPLTFDKITAKSIF